MCLQNEYKATAKRFHVFFTAKKEKILTENSWNIKTTKLALAYNVQEPHVVCCFCQMII